MFYLYKKQMAKIQFFGIGSATLVRFYCYNALIQSFIVTRWREKKLYLCRRKKTSWNRLKKRDFGTRNTSK